jgi:hypothetical protein
MRARFTLLALGLVALLFGAGAVGTALASPASPAVAKIHVCRSAKNGALFLWGACPKGYVAYTWNVTGPIGPRGFTGAPGPTGATGAAGPSFAPTFTMTLPGLHRETCKAVTAAGVITAITCTHRRGD